MIIQCEKCRTRFRLDDSRVSDKGVKVRCTKCKHVFRVQKEGAEAEPFELGGTLSGFSPSATQGELPAAPPEEQQADAEAVPDASFDTESFAVTPPHSETIDSSSFETSSFDVSTMAFESEELQNSDSGKIPAEAVEPVAKVDDEVDFSSFNFGGIDLEPESTMFSAAPVDDFTGIMNEPAARKEASQGLDFSDDDMFGAVVQPAPEVPGEAISFDFEGDSFAESMDMGGQDSRSKGGALFSNDTHADTPFNLGDIDFGDELTSVAIQQVNPEDLKPSQEILFAPLAEAQQVKPADIELTQPPESAATVADQQELPPLPITSRSKQSPLFGVLIGIIALLVISVLGYVGYSSFYTPKEVAVSDNGKISVKSVKAAYIENSEAGELLVISGEALNEYPKPRAALQVKVTLFDAAGQTLATKSAYGGNPLTEEQLKSLPLDKIEATMANQFGDSLANMEVAPGGAIPFVVVLANIPEGVKDFGVQSAGSTVATGKQK
ncbi:MAG: zinc-ribbon domain-containing protein [Deltaproteobacteria bacterium]|nr:zinc-ribbon domain-containing protein [Deltaproteobacteria bacterium]